jgi:hypothetical protein
METKRYDCWRLSIHLYKRRYIFLIIDKPKPFNFREFVFFEIEFFSKRVDDVECENCLLETRKKIKEFFDYADCSGKDEVTAE